MKSFDYHKPASLGEAAALLRGKPASVSIIAGGTDLLVLMKEQVIAPKRVVDIKAIPGMADFDYDPEQGLRLGALATVRDVETAPVTRAHYASLAKSATDFASVQVRNRATLVGNICRASPSADTLPPLIADGAVLRLHGPDGERHCPVEAFFTGPGRTVLADGEIVTHVDIPAPAPRTGKAYIKHGRRQQMELATVGVAAHVTLDTDGTIADAAIVMASVAPTPLRAAAVEALLRGNRPTDDVLRAAAEAACEAARPISDYRSSATYRADMVRVLTGRALRQALNEVTA